MRNDNLKPEKKLAAVCGLFCTSCTVYIGTHEDQARLEKFATQLQCTVEDLRCHGCRSEKLAAHCRDCYFKKCAAEKNIDFCGDCNEYPCAELKDFQCQMPHRIELWDDQDKIKQSGYEKWYQEMLENYTCPDCNTINSAYDIACRHCGTTPGNNYIKKHKTKIEEYFQKRK